LVRTVFKHGNESGDQFVRFLSPRLQVQLGAVLGNQGKHSHDAFPVHLVPILADHKISLRELRRRSNKGSGIPEMDTFPVLDQNIGFYYLVRCHSSSNSEKSFNYRSPMEHFGAERHHDCPPDRRQ